MRIATILAPNEYGSAGAGAGTTPIAEKVFALFRNCYTKTATITAASFVRGAPAILTAASASNNGYDIVNAETAGNVANNLFVGMVYDYPDTTTGGAGVWQPEDLGWVQVYGFASNLILHVASTTIAAGLLAVPDTGSRFETIAALSFASASASTDAHTLVRSGVFGMVVLYQTVASQADGTAAVKAFLRCM